MRDEGGGRRGLIVTADDMGLSAAWDDAIVRACEHGVVTSTSIATTGRCYRDAASMLSAAGFDHGIHLDLLDGDPLSPASEISSLVDRRGRFHPLRELLLRFATRRVVAGEVEREWGRQIERAIADGLRPSHLNGHYHVHLLPGLFGVAVRLASRFGIRWIRMPDEPPWFALPGTRPTRVAKTTVLWMLSRAQRGAARRPEVGHIDCRSVGPGGHAWRGALGRIRGKITEVFCHPGQSDEEMAVLMSPALGRTIDGAFRRTSFRDLHGAS